MPVMLIPPCAICGGAPRFRIELLTTGRKANVCSIKCLLSWCLGFSLGTVQEVAQKLLKGLPTKPRG
jgi:hypothetical protein